MNGEQVYERNGQRDFVFLRRSLFTRRKEQKERVLISSGDEMSEKSEIRMPNHEINPKSEMWARSWSGSHELWSKRRQAGRTPNASRFGITLRNWAKPLECAELAPAFLPVTQFFRTL